MPEHSLIVSTKLQPIIRAKIHGLKYFQYGFVLLFCINLLIFPSQAIASFNKTLWPVWLLNNPLSTQQIDHHLWGEFLHDNMLLKKDGINRLKYNSMSVADKKKLDRYIKYLSSIDIVQYNRQEQLAYWLNLYNALTVKTIIEYYPVRSIKDVNISPGLFSIGPWGAQLVEIQGYPLTLDDINNKIIRAIWNDQRTHYALNNGSLGAPNLQITPYTGLNIEEQLNNAATQYINSLRGVQMIEGSLIVSKLYKWYIEDFGGDEKDVIQHLEFFAKEPLKSQLKHVNSIDSYIYNWHLNSV